MIVVNVVQFRHKLLKAGWCEAMTVDGWIMPKKHDFVQVRLFNGPCGDKGCLTLEYEDGSGFVFASVSEPYI